MKLEFKRAERKQKKGKITIMGPSGSGKTYTSLLVARGLAGPEGKIALGDTERNSGALYATEIPGGYDHVNLPDREYETYIALINEAAKAGYSVLVIDSISHAWEAFLEMHELEAARSKNSYTAWSKITPKYQKLIDTVVSAPMHVICTMRTKTDYVLEERNGKQIPKKVGMAPIMRPGSEYEFDVVATVDLEHNLFIEKTRCSGLDGKAYPKAGVEFGVRFREWLESGSAEEPKAAAPTPAAQAAPAARPIAYDITTKLQGRSEGEIRNLKIWLENKGGQFDDESGLWVFQQPIAALEGLEVKQTQEEARA